MSFLAILEGITKAAEVGMTIYSGIKQNQETERINKINQENAEKMFKEEKKQLAFSNNLATMQTAMSRESLDFQEKQATLNRQDRLEQTGYNRLQNAANQFSNYLNSKLTLQNNALSPLMARGRQ
jgi:predicted GIY-YIG superfamily endonuclease